METLDLSKDVAIRIKSFKVKNTKNTSFLVTLPRPWVKDLKVKVGSILNFYRTQNGKLIITKEE